MNFGIEIAGRSFGAPQNGINRNDGITNRSACPDCSAKVVMVSGGNNSRAQSEAADKGYSGDYKEARALVECLTGTESALVMVALSHARTRNECGG